MLEKFYIIFVVLQKIITIKDAILHLKKIMLFLFAEKRKIRPKNPVGRKCSVVIIMSMFYPLETLGNSSKNRWRSDYTRPTDGIYPIFGGKKRMRFLAIYS